MTRLPHAILFVYFAVLMSGWGHAFAMSTSGIDSIIARIDYFGQFLDHYPPDVKDSAEAERFSKDLVGFIDSIISLGDRVGSSQQETYLVWLAELYSFAHNLDMPGAWQKCTDYYEEILASNPKSSKARIGLAAHFGSTFTPEDSASYGRIRRAISLVMDVILDGKDTTNRAVYSNLLFLGLLVHSKALCSEATFKYSKYFPSDTTINIFRRMTETIKDKCVDMVLDGSHIIYQNHCARFKVTYPEDLILFEESSSSKSTEVQLLLPDSPLTETKQGEQIRNALSVIAVPAKGNSRKSLVELFLKGGGIQMTVKLEGGIPEGFESFKFWATSGAEDKITGIFSIVKGKEYYYEILYSATASTFNKNLQLFKDFQMSFTITDY